MPTDIDYFELARSLLGPGAVIVEADQGHIVYKLGGRYIIMGITLKPKPGYPRKKCH